MFENSIDNKSTYTNAEGYELLDLGESIFEDKFIYNGMGYTFNKVPKNMEMRPDLAAISVYNDINYTELLLKYNNIQNPFTLYEDELLIIPSSTQITKHVGTPVSETITTQDALIRNYHAYVDKNKLPNTVGSEKNSTTISKANDQSNLTRSSANEKLSGNTATRFKEANMAPVGSTPIKEVNGRLYFGANSGIKCAADGVTTADYFKEVIKNSIDNS